MAQRKTGGSGLWLLGVMAGLFLLVGVGILGYLYMFTNQLGWGGPDINRWQVSADFSQISDVQYRWSLSYHTGDETQFKGFVRHATQDRMAVYPLITHDILVTTGDYANVNLVSTQVDVLLHHFFWQSRTANRRPTGTINLLHTVPINQSVYQQLLKIRSGDQVVVRGREIDKISAFDLKAKRDAGFWQDDGCDSILVTGVTWIKP
jgi:hypothetical protein